MKETADTDLARWLRAELEERGWGVRTLARHMNPDDVEQARRAVNRYLFSGSHPNPQNRALIARALDVAEDVIPAQPFRSEAA